MVKNNIRSVGFLLILLAFLFTFQTSLFSRDLTDFFSISRPCLGDYSIVIDPLVLQSVATKALEYLDSNRYSNPNHQKYKKIVIS